jgi:hypothetical protein
VTYAMQQQRGQLRGSLVVGAWVLHVLQQVCRTGRLCVCVCVCVGGCQHLRLHPAIATQQGSLWPCVFFVLQQLQERVCCNNSNVTPGVLHPHPLCTCAGLQRLQHEACASLSEHPLTASSLQGHMQSIGASTSVSTVSCLSQQAWSPPSQA